MRAAALALAASLGAGVAGLGGLVAGLGGFGDVARADPVWGCDGVGYGHALGAGWRDLVLMVPSSAGAIPARLTLDEGKTFAGLPVCGDLDGDGVDEIVTVEVDVLLGPQIAVYAKTRGRIAASLPLGDSGATLAVVGVVRSADQGLIGGVDGGGTFHAWAIAGGRLVARGAAPGYAPGGGVRACGDARDWVLARADASAVEALRWSTEGLTATRISNEVGDLPRLLVCEGD